MGNWPREFDRSRRAFAQLKNFTSSAIGRFASSVSLADSGREAEMPYRYRYELAVPDSTRHEIALLKGIVATAVMSHETRQPIYRQQRELLVELLDAIWSDPEQYLEPALQEDWAVATTEAQQRRVVIDQVASLTDAAAIAWHQRICG